MSVGVVRIVMHGCDVEPPPLDLEEAIRDEYGSLSTSRLLWLLSALAEELAQRGIVTAPPSDS